jgi:hypothetical protein
MKYIRAEREGGCGLESDPEWHSGCRSDEVVQLSLGCINEKNHPGDECSDAMERSREVELPQGKYILFKL